jgi:SAM-dependent methyltransferase
MSADRRRQLRAIFAEDAELYDRARPGYPAALFADMVTLAALRPGARVLEIGPGTGQATLPMARRGFRITAVELGEAMAAVARRKLAAYPQATVHTAAFEDWPLPAEPFDLVLAATAFHWLDPDVRWQKAAAALRPGGWLGIVETIHVATGDLAFFAASQACYERWDPDTPPGGVRLPPPDSVADDPSEIAATGLFLPPLFRRYLREIPYTRAQYLAVLDTYSGHRAMEPGRREGLYRCIGALIDGPFGGRIRKGYLTRLVLARRR